MAVDEDIARVVAELDRFVESKLTSLYDAKRDVLFIFRIGAPKRSPAIAIDVNGQFWVRQHPSTGEIDDIEIEDFEGAFLVKHPQLRSGWLRAKAYKSQDNKTNRAFISQIVALLRHASAAGARR